MTVLEKTVKFDPGWGHYVLVYSGSVEYLYRDINKFKNLSQRSFKFKQYFPKIVKLLENNIGFYLGCLLWAVYLKNSDDADFLGNHCLGQKYDENAPDLEIDYILTSIDKLKNDYKYYTGKTTDFPEVYKTILVTYNEFSILNKGFTETRNTTDLKLPSNLKTPSKEELEKINSSIESVVESGKLEELIPLADIIL